MWKIVTLLRGIWSRQALHRKLVKLCSALGAVIGGPDTGFGQTKL